MSDEVAFDLNKVANLSTQKERDEELFKELENDNNDDATLRHIREARLNELKLKAMESQFALQNRTSTAGIYVELAEKDFLKFTTGNRKCIVHFFHDDFSRCDIMNKHLEILSKKYPQVNFAKINVDKAKFFVNKLNIQMLPAVLLFEDGILKNRIIGFEQLGGSDNFPTKVLEDKLSQLGFVKKLDGGDESGDEEKEEEKRKGGLLSANRKIRSSDKNDEDSD